VKSVLRPFLEDQRRFCWTLQLEMLLPKQKKADDSIQSPANFCAAVSRK